MIVLAVDPGNEQSAWLRYDVATGMPLDFGKWPNKKLVDHIAFSCTSHNPGPWVFSQLAVEMIASYGMPVGREVFETCVWIGRIWEAWGDESFALVYRKDVKLHLCGQPRARDANIRQALIDKYGGKDKAIGKKANPGPLYGISADVWSALAIAVTFAETKAAAKEAA